METILGLNRYYLTGWARFSFPPVPIDLDFNTPVQASFLFAVIGGEKFLGTFSDNGNLKRIDPLGYQIKLYRGCKASALHSVKSADEISP